MREAIRHPVTWIIGFVLVVGGALAPIVWGWSAVAIQVFGIVICITHDIVRGRP
jgi:hypothetical protein